MPQGGLMVTVLRLAGVISAGFAASLLFSASAFAQSASADQQPPATPTFTKDVLPILQRSCQSCHRPGTPAPMSLLTYAEARPWARSIKTKRSEEHTSELQSRLHLVCRLLLEKK